MGLRDYLHYKQAHHRKEAQGQQRTSSDGSADASIVSCGAVQTDAVLPLYGIIIGPGRRQVTDAGPFDHFLRWEFSCQWLDNGGLLYHQPPSVHHLKGLL